MCKSGWKNKKPMSGSITSMMKRPKEPAAPTKEEMQKLWKQLGKNFGTNLKGKPKAQRIKIESEKNTL
jgi:hypothetical protein